MSPDLTAYAELSPVELRRRLEEAEETIRAIREGEVDALIMRNPKDQDEVFTLEGGTESYRAFMEAMDIGAAAFDSAGRLIYANQALSELFGPDGNILDSVPEADAQNILAVVAGARAAKASREIVLPTRLGERHVLVSGSPLTLGLSCGVALTFVDITERVRADAAREAERAALAIIASANEAVIVCDLSGVITHSNAAVANFTACDPVGLDFDQAVELLVPGENGPVRGSEFVARAVAGTPVQGLEATAPKSPRVRELLFSAAPILLGDRISGCVVTMVDLSQRKAAEKQQLLLMGELDHRVKNTLALVMSISKRTSSPEGTVEGFQRAFAARIHALAATHNILAERSWNSVGVAETIRVELEPHVNDMAAQVSLSGDDVSLLPRAAISLGLVIHELATNAAKYGALSAPNGRIEVTVEDISPRGARIVWKERGGPAVTAPTRTGFGQTVITRSMQYADEGGAEIVYEPDGLRCTIVVPGIDLVAD